jgi:hypothetical protein
MGIRHRRLGARNIGAALFDLRLRVHDRGLLRRQSGLRLVDPRLVDLWIDACNYLSLLHGGVEIGVERQNISGDLRADLHGHHGVWCPGGRYRGSDGATFRRRRTELRGIRAAQSAPSPQA